MPVALLPDCIALSKSLVCWPRTNKKYSPLFLATCEILLVGTWFTSLLARSLFPESPGLPGKVFHDGEDTMASGEACL